MREIQATVQYQRVKAYTFGEAGKNEIHMMLEKGQLFVKQAKKILDKYELTN